MQQKNLPLCGASLVPLEANLLSIYIAHVEPIGSEGALDGFERVYLSCVLYVIFLMPVFKFALFQSCGLPALSVSKYSPNQCIPLSPHHRSLVLLNQFMTALSNESTQVLMQCLRPRETIIRVSHMRVAPYRSGDLK